MLTNTVRTILDALWICPFVFIFSLSSSPQPVKEDERPLEPGSVLGLGPEEFFLAAVKGSDRFLLSVKRRLWL